jgi:hypothetical protein
MLTMSSSLEGNAIVLANSLNSSTFERHAGHRTYIQSIAHSWFAPVASLRSSRS